MKRFPGIRKICLVVILTAMEIFHLFRKSHVFFCRCHNNDLCSMTHHKSLQILVLISSLRHQNTWTNLCNIESEISSPVQNIQQLQPNTKYIHFATEYSVIVLQRSVPVFLLALPPQSDTHKRLYHFRGFHKSSS